MHFDDILANLHNNHCEGVNESWTQGRTLYGGLTGGLLCHVARQAVPQERLLRSIDIGLLKPVIANTPFSLHTETLASGRTVTFQEVRLMQEGKLCATARADFVLPMGHDVKASAFEVPVLKALDAEGVFHFSQILSHLPTFMQHFNNVLTTEALPFSNQSTPQMGGWMRFATPAKALTEAHLVCLIDSWPPTAAIQYDAMRPMSTLNWTVHFSDAWADSPTNAHIGYLSEVNFGEHGVSSSSANIWLPDGTLAARSHQLNVIYDPVT